MRIRDTLTRKDFGLTRSEAKIAQVLLDEYPISGLGTATALAKRAGVSDPTVIRLGAKIGFDGLIASFFIIKAPRMTLHNRASGGRSSPSKSLP